MVSNCLPIESQMRSHALQLTLNRKKVAMSTRRIATVVAIGGIYQYANMLCVQMATGHLNESTASQINRQVQTVCTWMESAVLFALTLILQV